MKVTNLTASTLTIGPLVVRPAKTRILTADMLAQDGVRTLIGQLKKHRKIDAEPEHGDDADLAPEPRPKDPNTPPDDRIVRPRGTLPRPLPGSIREMTRLDLATRPVSDVREYGVHLGIPSGALDALSEDEARLYVGALALGDPGLWTKGDPQQS